MDWDDVELAKELMGDVEETCFDIETLRACKEALLAGIRRAAKEMTERVQVLDAPIISMSAPTIRPNFFYKLFMERSDVVGVLTDIVDDELVCIPITHEEFYKSIEEREEQPRKIALSSLYGKMEPLVIEPVPTDAFTEFHRLPRRQKSKRKRSKTFHEKKFF